MKPPIAQNFPHRNRFLSFFLLLLKREYFIVSTSNYIIINKAKKTIMKQITGKIVSQPLTIRHNDSIIVIILVKDNENGECTECYYVTPVFDYRSSKQFFNTSFSRIALSGIGDEVKIEYSTLPESNYEIMIFDNITQGR